MLYKKIYIMKGNDMVKSVLKLALIENGFTELELNTHYTYGESYTFILKSGVFVHVESFNGRYLKRRLPPFEIGGVSAAVCYNGKILCMTAPTPYVPMDLIELSQKYSTIKVDALNDADKANTIDTDVETENLENNSLEMETSSEKVETIGDGEQAENGDTEENAATSCETSAEDVTADEHDICEDYNILDILPDEKVGEENDFRSLAMEIEQKYEVYPHNEVLENVFPGSKWIIGDDLEPSLGLLYDSTEITHICYAKKGEESFDANASFHEGYWVIIENIV